MLVFEIEIGWIEDSDQGSKEGIDEGDVKDICGDAARLLKGVTLISVLNEDVSGYDK